MTTIRSSAAFAAAVVDTMPLLVDSFSSVALATGVSVVVGVSVATGVSVVTGVSFAAGTSAGGVAGVSATGVTGGAVLATYSLGCKFWNCGERRLIDEPCDDRRGVKRQNDFFSFSVVSVS
ncbi:hypothetical protein ACQ86N_14685 [Puia sp. P3]|uniref:hypothetical protein n=1 Tax=Puia sp. P3 TaxID=3423952 RepID=UPI003D66E5DD